MIARMLTLIRKEFIALLRDKRSRMILIMPPILQMCIFAFAATLEVKNNAITIFNEDGGPASTEIINRLTRAGAFSELHYVFSNEDIRQDIESQRSLLALHFSKDFSADTSRSHSPKLQVIVDGRRSNSGQIALGYINRITNEYFLEQQSEHSLYQPSELIVRHWFNPNRIYLWHNVPGLLMILTTLVSMIVTAMSVARERELGTFDQLLVSPFSPGEILIGKAIPAYIIALVESLFIIFVGVFLYQVPFVGSIPLLYASLSIYLLALIGVGLFISSLCQTQQQAILGVFCFILPAVLLSGFASPVENMPDWLQTIDQINPLRHFFPVVKGMFLKDMSALMVWQYTWPLLIIGAVTLASANWLFRHKMG